MTLQSTLMLSEGAALSGAQSRAHVQRIRYDNVAVDGDRSLMRTIPNMRLI